MPLFPIFLKLAGRRCLIVGAGNVAAEKIASLLHAQADLTVVSPEALPAIAQQAQAGMLVWHPRRFAPSDLDGVFMVIAATSSPEVNHQIFLLAGDRGILCNSVDDPPNCDFYFSSIVERGALQIAISTAGESPALAQRLRKEIDAQLDSNLGNWLDQLGQLRREILQKLPSGEDRKMLLHRLASLQLCALPNCPARQIAESAVNETSTPGK